MNEDFRSNGAVKNDFIMIFSKYLIKYANINSGKVNSFKDLGFVFNASLKLKLSYFPQFSNKNFDAKGIILLRNLISFGVDRILLYVCKDHLNFMR